MATYEVGYDAASGIIRYTLLDQVPDQDAKALGAALLQAVHEARRDSPAVRILMDNRKGVQFSTSALQSAAGYVRSQLGPEDRVAVIVTSSLMKAQARAAMQDGQETFLSESAAVTWLNAWK